MAVDNGGDDAAQVETLVGAVEQVLKDGMERVKRGSSQSWSRPP